MRLRFGLLVVMVVTAACGSSSAANSTSTTTATHPSSTATPSITVSGQTAALACGPAGARTLAQDGVARVYEVQGTVYGCARGSAHDYTLGSATTCIRSARAGPAALAGTVVAYGLETCGVDTGSATVVVKRLTSGRQPRSLPATTGRLAPESYQQVGSIVVKADGAVAWIGAASSIIRHSQTLEVHRADGRGQVELASGAGIDPKSMRLHGTKLSWRQDGALRSSTLF